MKQINMIKTGINIGKKIDSSNFTVKDISFELGFGSTRSVYKWLSGQTLPSLDSLFILSDLLGVQIEELIIRE